MKAYLSHFSAAAYWDIPYLEAILGSEIDESKPAEFTFSRRGEAWDTKKRKVHLSQVALPPCAVVSKDGKRIASRELTFLQLASRLNIHRLILLGLQLCSHPPGEPSKSVTTKQKLKAFLVKCPGHNGHQNANRAVKYIENGSASVMESMAYMILTLPHSLGGYGLRGATFNHEITLDYEAVKRLGQRRCFIDLYYKSRKIAIEYDSFAYHSSPAEQGKDAIRSTILSLQGITVISLNTIQLYDKGACRDFAFHLASCLRKRIQIRTRKFDEMNILLRVILPTGKAADDIPDIIKEL